MAGHYAPLARALNSPVLHVIDAMLAHQAARTPTFSCRCCGLDIVRCLCADEEIEGALQVAAMNLEIGHG